MSSLEQLVCVEYPGVVDSPTNMLDTMGGLETIAQVLEEPNRRLELRFRPEDVFCKPTCGEKHSGSSFLVKVKRKKLKPGRDTSKPATKHTVEVEGAVTDCYRFNNLCDFQYLPMSESHTSIYPQVYSGSTLPSSSWITSPSPLFTPPAAFSRMDLPQDYQFRREAGSSAGPDTPHNIIGRTRQRRSHHAIFVTYDVEKVPDKPREVALNQIKLKFIDQERLALVRDNFSKRPVWSKNALHAITAIPPDRLKLILPVVSYYFTTGPWRNQWIRFGYDPRVEAGAAIHQTLDYRQPTISAVHSYSGHVLS